MQLARKEPVTKEDQLRMAIVALNSLGHQIWELANIQGDQGAGTSVQAKLEQKVQRLEEQVQQLEKESADKEAKITKLINQKKEMEGLWRKSEKQLRL